MFRSLLIFSQQRTLDRQNLSPHLEQSGAPHLDATPTTLVSVSIHLRRLAIHSIPAMLNRRSAIDNLFGSDPSFLGIQSSTLVLGVMKRDMSAPGQLGSEEVREDGVN